MFVFIYSCMYVFVNSDDNRVVQVGVDIVC